MVEYFRVLEPENGRQVHIHKGMSVKDSKALEKRLLVMHACEGVKENMLTLHKIFSITACVTTIKCLIKQNVCMSVISCN